MTQTAPNRRRQTVAWAGIQGARVPLQRPANDNRGPRRRGRTALLWLAGVLASGVVVLLLLARI